MSSATCAAGTRITEYAVLMIIIELIQNEISRSAVDDCLSRAVIKRILFCLSRSRSRRLAVISRRRATDVVCSVDKTNDTTIVRDSVKYAADIHGVPVVSLGFFFFLITISPNYLVQITLSPNNPLH